MTMTAHNAPPVYIVGDVHGQYEQLIGLLRGVGLVDERLDWAGGAALLWFIGDFFDRGPCGIASVDLVMRLQIQAEQVGGCVRALLGNHEPLILSAQRFGEQRTAWGGTFLWDWRRNGGNDEELERLTPAHVAWLSDLPAMARVGNYLLVHADSTIYSSYGETIAEVNQAFKVLLHSDDAPAWDQLLAQFSHRKAFIDQDADGAARAAAFLHDFGGQQIIHGHTPISAIRHCMPEEVTEPLIYADGLCVNVDGGLYLGGPGFVYQLPGLE
jgi:hypothetical protein